MKKIWKAAAAAVIAAGLAGCQKQEEEEVVTEAAMNEALSTKFFDYTVTGAYTTTAIGDILTWDGEMFLVVDVSITNRAEEKAEDAAAIPMSETDFWLSYGEGENDYTAPLTSYGESLMPEEELPSSYEIQDGETRTGKLLFVVPSGSTTFGLKTQDYYTITEKEETTTVEGEIYTITFTAEAK